MHIHTYTHTTANCYYHCYYKCVHTTIRRHRLHHHRHHHHHQATFQSRQFCSSPPPSIDPAPPDLAPQSRLSAQVMPPKLLPPRLPSHRVFLYPCYARQRKALRETRRTQSAPPTCGCHDSWVSRVHTPGALNVFRHASCPPQLERW